MYKSIFVPLANGHYASLLFLCELLCFCVQVVYGEVTSQMLPQKGKNRHGERVQAQLVLAPSMMLRAPWIVPNVINPGLLLNMQPCCRMMHLSMPQMMAAGQPVFDDHHWNNQFCGILPIFINLH